jgi:hypothetical protein
MDEKAEEPSKRERTSQSADKTLASCVPALKLNRYPRFFAATLAALPSISETPFLDS